MSNLILPDSPDPTAKGLIDHERLEFYPNSKSGIEALLNADEGYIVGRLQNELLRYKTDAHFLTISPTGGGKGTGLIIPNLLDHPGSVFVVDIKGETVAKTATARRLLGQTVVVLDPFDIMKGQWGRDSYNPFDRLPKDRDDRWTDGIIMRLTEALMFDPKENSRTKGEAVWEEVTKELISGLITYCAYYTRPHRHNLTEILKILQYNSSEKERFIDELKGIVGNDPQGQNDPQLIGLITFLTETKETTKFTDNALAQARNMLRWTSTNSFKGIIQDSTFTFEDLQNGRMTVYLVVPEEFIDNCASWVRIMLESAVFSIKDVFNTKGVSTSQLPQEDRVLFMLDELPAFGQLDIISSGMATLRSRGVNLWLFIQNLAQLDATYGKEKARTIIGNAASVQVFSSNELEELEYFVRLIGEEFFDVQSVTISETKTDGTSTAIGQSHTVNNSESVSETKGTSLSDTKGANTTWSDTFGRTTNKGRTDTKGTNTNEGTNTNWNKGESTGEGLTRNRNMLSSIKVSDNENKGKNKNRGGGRMSGSGNNASTAITVNDGISTTQNKGGGENESTTTGSNESVSMTKQKGYSDTTSETTTTTESTALGRSISVKQERMKIETVRSLREKLSNRNQLLQVRGFHPFFLPRMSYFEKFMEDDRYLFPDMVAIVNIDSFGSFATSRLMKVEKSRNVDNLFNDIGNLLKIKAYANQWNTNGNFGEKNKEVAMSYRDFLSKDLTGCIDKYQVLEERLREQRESFNELAVVCLAFISAMQNLGMKDFMDAGEDLIARMIEIEEHSRQKIDLSGMFQKYRALPLASMTDNYFTPSDPQNPWDIHDETMTWLAHTYSPTITRISQQLEAVAEKLKQSIKIQEDTRRWLENSVEKIAFKIDEAIGIAMEREMQVKHEFFMKRNMIE